MRGLKSIGFVIAVVLPLCAQDRQVKEHQLGAYKGDEDSIRSVMNYCDAVDDSAQQQQARIFAKSKTDSTAKPKGYSWKEFSNRDEWEAGGKPVPVVFGWSKDDAIVRVTVVARPPRARSPALAHTRLDYCYGSDAKLIRIRAVWYAPTNCEYLFPCRLISGREFYLIQPQRPGVTDWVFTPDGTITKLRNGKAVDDYFDPCNSLRVDDLHLRRSNDLPFNHLPSTK